MTTKTVRVELGDDGKPIRIFRKDKKWLECPEDRLAWMTKAEAVHSIREQVYARSWDPVERGTHDHRCEHCGRYITWEGFEMNEKKFKGEGGEVSLQNCEALCHDCHQGSPDSVHGNRRWQTSKIKQGQNGTN